MRGIQRASKKGHVSTWAETELQRLDPLIESGYTYLEEELRRVTKEEGNSVSVIRILKFLAEAREVARRTAAESAASHHGAATAEEERRHYDLGSIVDSVPG